jgi:hypothetical protein
VNPLSGGQRQEGFELLPENHTGQAAEQLKEKF